jgi:hypothetical protein
MAFTPDTIEIRLIINGNLVNTMTMPRLGLIASKVRKMFLNLYIAPAISANVKALWVVGSNPGEVSAWYL